MIKKFLLKRQNKKPVKKPAQGFNFLGKQVLSYVSLTSDFLFEMRVPVELQEHKVKFMFRASNIYENNIWLVDKDKFLNVAFFDEFGNVLTGSMSSVEFNTVCRYQEGYEPSGVMSRFTTEIHIPSNCRSIHLMIPAHDNLERFPWLFYDSIHLNFKNKHFVRPIGGYAKMVEGEQKFFTLLKLNSDKFSEKDFITFRAPDLIGGGSAVCSIIQLDHIGSVIRPNNPTVTTESIGRDGEVIIPIPKARDLNKPKFTRSVLTKQKNSQYFLVSGEMLKTSTWGFFHAGGITLASSDKIAEVEEREVELGIFDKIVTDIYEKSLQESPEALLKLLM